MVSNKERLCRFGFELIESIIKNTGCTIFIIGENGKESLSTNRELAKALLSILTVFYCRQVNAGNLRNWPIFKPVVKNINSYKENGRTKRLAIL